MALSEIQNKYSKWETKDEPKKMAVTNQTQITKDIHTIHYVIRYGNRWCAVIWSAKVTDDLKTSSWKTDARGESFELK